MCLRIIGTLPTTLLLFIYGLAINGQPLKKNSAEWAKKKIAIFSLIFELGYTTAIVPEMLELRFFWYFCPLCSGKVCKAVILTHFL